MKIKNFLITLFIIFIPSYSYSLIEVDITMSNLDPLPLTVSTLSISDDSIKIFKTIIKTKI